MRKILGILLLIAATVLVAHGLFTEAEAARRMPEVATTTDVHRFKSVAVDFPYCQATIDASISHLNASLPSVPKTRYIDTREFARTVLSMHQTLLKGASAKPPYLTPEAATVAGFVALLIAILLPATRFRFLGFLLLLGAVFASLAASFSPEAQLVLCQDIPPSLHIIAWMPRIGQGLIALAGLLFLFEKGAKPAVAGAH